MSGCPPGMYSLPPMATKSFLFASTSFEAMCQWPMVTPAWLIRGQLRGRRACGSVDVSD